MQLLGAHSVIGSASLTIPLAHTARRTFARAGTQAGGLAYFKPDRGPFCLLR